MSLHRHCRALDPRLKWLVLSLLAAAGVVALLVIGPIERSTYTYQFPDARTFFGVPYFLNVVSNVPFVVVGVLGLRALPTMPASLRPALGVLFVGVFLTGFGSAYHHLAPGNSRLIFDRLPMTFAFAGVFSAAIGDRMGSRVNPRVLVVCLFIAIGSALYWYFSGQLRPYVFVQGYPMIAIPAMLLLYPGRWLDGRHFMIAVGLYAAAKVVERYDREIYELGHLISGHSIKHLLAAWATWHLVAMARGRGHRRVRM